MKFPVVYNEHPVRKTRKDSRCFECRRLIPKGSACMVAEGIWEDGPERYRWCLPCNLLRREAMSLITDSDELLCFGELYEFIGELR